MAQASEAFEGVEKRLFVKFCTSGLLSLPRETWQDLLKKASCQIISEMESGDGAGRCRAYILSESSLFTYDDTVVLKTCGETSPLDMLKSLLHVVRQLACIVNENEVRGRREEGDGRSRCVCGGSCSAAEKPQSNSDDEGRYCLAHSLPSCHEGRQNSSLCHSLPPCACVPTRARDGSTDCRLASSASTDRATREFEKERLDAERRKNKDRDADNDAQHVGLLDLLLYTHLDFQFPERQPQPSHDRRQEEAFLRGLLSSSPGLKCHSLYLAGGGQEEEEDGCDTRGLFVFTAAREGRGECFSVMREWAMFGVDERVVLDVSGAEQIGVVDCKEEERQLQRQSMMSERDTATKEQMDTVREGEDQRQQQMRCFYECSPSSTGTDRLPTELVATTSLYDQAVYSHTAIGRETTFLCPSLPVESEPPTSPSSSFSVDDDREDGTARHESLFGGEEKTAGPPCCLLRSSAATQESNRFTYHPFVKGRRQQSEGVEESNELLLLRARAPAQKSSTQSLLSECHSAGRPERLLAANSHTRAQSFPSFFPSNKQDKSSKWFFSPLVSDCLTPTSAASTSLTTKNDRRHGDVHLPGAADSAVSDDLSSFSPPSTADASPRSPLQLCNSMAEEHFQDDDDDEDEEDEDEDVAAAAATPCDKQCSQDLLEFSACLDQFWFTPVGYSCNLLYCARHVTPELSLTQQKQQLPPHPPACRTSVHPPSASSSSPRCPWASQRLLTLQATKHAVDGLTDVEDHCSEGQLRSTVSRRQRALHSTTDRPSTCQSCSSQTRCPYLTVHVSPEPETSYASIEAFAESMPFLSSLSNIISKSVSAESLHCVQLEAVQNPVAAQRLCKSRSKTPRTEERRRCSSSNRGEEEEKGVLHRDEEGKYTTTRRQVVMAWKETREVLTARGFQLSHSVSAYVGDQLFVRHDVYRRGVSKANTVESAKEATMDFEHWRMFAEDTRSDVEERSCADGRRKRKDGKARWRL